MEHKGKASSSSSDLPRENEGAAKRHARLLTPLWIISVFMSFAEGTVGIVASKTNGVVQVAFTGFAIVFPLLIVALFFVVLWNRPWVLYAPSEYPSSIKVGQFVGAYRMGSKRGRDRRSEQQPVAEGLACALIRKRLAGADVRGAMEVLDEVLPALENQQDRGELSYVYAILLRLSGAGAADAALKKLRNAAAGTFPYADYESALLHFAKYRSLKGFDTPVDLGALGSDMRRLWSALLAVVAVRESNTEGALKYYKYLRWGNKHPDHFDIYVGIPAAIAAAALGEAEDAGKYLDLARIKDRRIEYKTDDYPFVVTTAKLDRAFVQTLIGITKDSGITNTDISPLKGHAHMLAACASILKGSEAALTTLETLGSGWKRPLHRDEIRRRVKSFEEHLLSHAGTIFLGT